MGEFTNISHEISKFGRLEIALSDKAGKFYQLLNIKGIISELRRMDHLGFISKSHPGNNHKRWDYVCLQLHLLQQLRQSAPEQTGLSSVNIPGIKRFKLTKAEVIQIAILFANIGHIIGTIASEKALLDFLNSDFRRSDSFFKPFEHDKEVKEFCEKIQSEHRWYHVKYLIAFNFIYSYINDQAILEAIKLFFLKPLHLDSPGVRRMKQTFFSFEK